MATIFRAPIGATARRGAVQAIQDLARSRFSSPQLEQTSTLRSVGAESSSNPR